MFHLRLTCDVAGTYRETSLRRRYNVLLPGENILMDENSCENILNYDISYKTLIGSKPLHIRFDKIDGFIRFYDGSRYLTLFGSEKYDAIYDRIRIL